MIDYLSQQWQVGHWHGFEKWTCLKCKWSTVNGPEAARDYELTCPRCHPAGEQPAPSPIVVADKSGKIISGG